MTDLSGLKDVLTTTTAVGAFILGIFNLWHAKTGQRVRLTVLPKAAYELGGGGILSAVRMSANTPDRPPDLVCLEVTNMSTFPITVSDAGFTMTGKIGTTARRAILKPILLDGGRWPRRLEARTSVSLYARYSSLGPDIRKAYVETDCGEVAYGDSPALETVRSLLAA
jgi:hypothetical protein